MIDSLMKHTILGYFMTDHLSKMILYVSYISPIHTFRNIPALLRKTNYVYYTGPGYSRSVNRGYNKAFNFANYIFLK